MGKTRRVLLAALAIAATAAPVRAQDGVRSGVVRGAVLGRGGEAIAGAQVVARSETGVERVALADSAGRYRLELAAGTYTVRVEVMGYRPLERGGVRIAAGVTETLDLVLVPAPVELAAIEVVGATRMATPVQAIPGAVSVVTREAVEEQATLTRNLGDLLGQTVPGFSQGVESPSLWGQSLRGRNVAVLIDGVPQYTARNVSRDLSTIDPAAIERVEVVRGATAVYGNGATGGVINIITRSASGEGVRFTTAVGMETSAGRLGESVGGHVQQLVTGRRGGLDFTLNGSYAHTGAFYDAEGDRIVPDPTGQGGLADTDTWDVLAKVGYTFGAQRLQLSVNHFDSEQDTEYGSDPTVAAAPPGEQKSRPVSGVEMDRPQGSRNTVVSVDYRNESLLGSRFHAQLFYRDYLTRFGPYDGRAAASLGHLFIQSYLDSRNVGGRLEFETALPFEGEPTLFWGVDYSVEETSQPVGIIDGDAYDASGGRVYRTIGEDIWVPPMEPRSLGLFAQLGWSPTERLVLRGGVRHERIGMHIDDFVTLAGNEIVGGRLDFDPFLFNVGVVFDATDAVSVFGAFSQGFTTTDIGLFLRSAPAGFEVGEKTLEPQKVDHYEVGVRAGSERARASFSAFFNRSDLGTSSAGFDLNVVRAPERVYGAEATLDVRPAEDWELGGTFTWTEGEFDPEEDGTYRALNGWRIQPMKLTGYVEHRMTSRWTNRVQLLYSGSRDRAFEERPDPEVIGFGERAVESYAVVDWVATLRVGPGTLRASVLNLLNNQYFPVASQLMRSGNNTTYTPGRGRTVSVGYSVSY